MLSAQGATSYIEGWANTMDKLSNYVLTAEAAEILGVSQNTVRAWARDGKIPVRRNPANGYRLFKRSELERFLRRIETATRQG